MALTGTFIKQNTKHSGAPAGDKHTDGGGMYLHVKEAGKYWRMNSRFAGQQKTLALGVYPLVSLAQARQGRDKARKLLAQGIDPSTAKQEHKQTSAPLKAKTPDAGQGERSLAAHGFTATFADTRRGEQRGGGRPGKMRAESYFLQPQGTPTCPSSTPSSSPSPMPPTP